MSNNAKIRTMQSDLEEARKDLTQKTDLQQASPALRTANTIAKNTKKPFIQPDLTVKTIKSEPVKQGAFLSAQQQIEKISASLPEEKKKAVLILPPKPAIQSSKKLNIAENSELKNLIKRISDETDEDPRNKDLTKKEIDKKDVLQAENKDSVNKIIDKSKNEEKTATEEILKEIADDLVKKDNQKKKNTEEKDAKEGAKELNALKEEFNKIKIEEAKVAEKTEKEIEILERNTQKIDAIEKGFKEAEAVEKIKEAEAEKRSAKEIEALEKNAKEIEALKTMISRISDSSINAKEKVQKSNIAESIAENYKQDIQQNSQLAKIQKVGDKPVSILPDKNENKFFWKNVSKKIKEIKGANELKKINDLNDKNEMARAKIIAENNSKKYNEQSGILQNGGREKEKVEKESLSKKAYNEDYTSPDRRLTLGKQEFYSSISKKIKLREKKDEMESLENSVAIKKQQKLLSKDDEYKKLKHNIIRKYHIKIFSLPWKKIIFTAALALIATGSISYFIFSRITPSPPIVTPPVIIGNEIQKFSVMKKKVTISRKDFEGFNNLEADVLNIFNSDKNVKVIKLIIIDNEIDKNILPLSEALDAVGITNTKEGTSYLPENFLQTVTNKYNLLIFKTDKETLRYGLAIEAKNKDFLSGIMKSWEGEQAKNKKMSSVFKPLFKNDKNFGESFSLFSVAFYKNIEMKYVHLIDKDTALNYFFYENILTITTSKESAFAVADLLISSK